MILIDQNKCKLCGQCVEICHQNCMTITDQTLSINYEICSTCTQCIAFCPRQALAWDGIAPIPFDVSRLPSPEQLDELFKQRRTVRVFKDEAIDRVLLDEIVSYGIYAPTNNYDLRAVVVDDKAIMDALDQILTSFVAKMYKILFRPKLVFNLLQQITPMINPKDKAKMESALARGYNFLAPPAMIFIIGDKRVGLSEASAQYALYNIILFAQTKGIGSRLRGHGQLFFDRSKAAREQLALQKHEHILGMVELGYPAVKFRNKVNGKKLPFRWNAG